MPSDTCGRSSQLRHITHVTRTRLDLWSPSLSSTTFVGHSSVYPLVGLHKQAYWVSGSQHVCTSQTGSAARQRALLRADY